MKYNKKLYDTSMMLSAYTARTKRSEEILKKQRELFKIIVKRFSQIKEFEGLACVTFVSKFYQEPDEGYNLIRELIELNAMDDLAKDYLLYLTKAEYLCDEYHTSYFEITWDYQNYYKFIKYQEVINGLENLSEEYRNRFMQDIVKTSKIYCKTEKELRRKRIK